MTLDYEGLEVLDKVAGDIISYAGGQSIWLFYGEMGSGKTTLIQRICAQIGVLDRVSSPTFSIVNEYQTASMETIYHFDFYRIDSEQEALDIGVLEYFDSGHLCLIEWPERISSLLPERNLKINLNFISDNKRSLSISKHGQTV